MLGLLVVLNCSALVVLFVKFCEQFLRNCFNFVVSLVFLLELCLGFRQLLALEFNKFSDLRLVRLCEVLALVEQGAKQLTMMNLRFEKLLAYINSLSILFTKELIVDWIKRPVALLLFFRYALHHAV